MFPISEEEANNCMRTETGDEYIGKTAKSKSGSDCAKWINTTDSKLAEAFPGMLYMYNR